MGILLSKLLAQFAVTFISSKALKAFGKLDYAECIKFGGFCVAGGTIVEIVQFISNNSKIIGFFKWFM